MEVMTDKVNVQIPSPRSGTGHQDNGQGGSRGEGGTINRSHRRGETPAVERLADQPAGSAPGVRSNIAPLQKVSATGGSWSAVLATPATHRLARELGVDISAIGGTGPEGRVTDEDVRRVGRDPDHAQQQQPRTQFPSSGLQLTRAPSLHRREGLIPLRGIRKTIAERMAKSSADHRTGDSRGRGRHDRARPVQGGPQGKRRGEGSQAHVSPLHHKVVISALKEFPYLNASLDERRATSF